ncbi:MAG: hypothetical protein ACI8UD_000510 [Planctomycetota bacterium]|jgi:hypothetical protein
MLATQAISLDPAAPNDFGAVSKAIVATLR